MSLLGFQDAVEMFLLLAAQYVDATLKASPKFPAVVDSRVRKCPGMCSYWSVRTGATVAEDAIERAYREQGRRLWWAVLAFSGDREIASDAVAEAFAQALARRDAIRAPDRWVWKAAFRIAAGELKRRGRLRAERRDGWYEMPEPSGLVVALARLSPKQRGAVILFHYAGYSLKETAAILGGTPATIGVHLTRGRRRLRELLLEENGEA